MAEPPQKDGSVTEPPHKDKPVSPDACLTRQLCAPLSDCQDFCREFQAQSGRLTMCTASDANSQWPRVFGTSPWFAETSPALLIIRALLALTFVVHLFWSLAQSFKSGYYFIYLTHWSLIVETAYMCFATFTAYAARKILVAGGTRKGSRLPWFVSLTWALHHVALPAAFLVFALYWLLDNPFYNLREMPGYLGFFVHGLNFVLILVDLFVGRNKFYLKHVICFFVYVVLYSTWTIVHFAADVGTHGGCKDYAKERCPIYAVLNWHKPISTGIMVVIIVCFVVPIVQYPCWWCVKKRNTIDEYMWKCSSLNRCYIEEGSARPSTESSASTTEGAEPSLIGYGEMVAKV